MPTFNGFGQSYFYPIKAMSWITTDYLQWTTYVKNKNSCLYVLKKKLAQNEKVNENEKVFLSLYCTHYLLQVSNTQIE